VKALPSHQKIPYMDIILKSFSKEKEWKIIINPEQTKKRRISLSNGPIPPSKPKKKGDTFIFGNNDSDEEIFRNIESDEIFENNLMNTSGNMNSIDGVDVMDISNNNENNVEGEFENFYFDESIYFDLEDNKDDGGIVEINDDDIVKSEDEETTEEIDFNIVINEKF